MPFRPVDPSRRAATPPVRMAQTVQRASARAPTVLGQSKDSIQLAENAAPIETDAACRAPIGGRAPAAKRAHNKVDHTGANWDENGDYIVGRGRPPKAAQWSKGQSGNPRGPKPRERLDPQAALDKEILAEFTARVNNTDVTLTMGTFAIQLLKANAAKGQVKAQQMLLELFMATVRKTEVVDDRPKMEPWEEELVADLIASYDLSAKPVIRQTKRSAGASVDVE